jgi:hypothetical protein
MALVVVAVVAATASVRAREARDDVAPDLVLESDVEVEAFMGSVAKAGYTSPYQVTFADFVRQSAASSGCVYDGFDGAYVAGMDGTCCIVAPVHLPDGATVAWVAFWLFDNAESDFTMSLRRKQIGNRVASTVMATATTAVESSSVRVFVDGSVADAVVDNSAYIYFITSDTCLVSHFGHRLYSATVAYSE